MRIKRNVLLAHTISTPFQLQKCSNISFCRVTTVSHLRVQEVTLRYVNVTPVREDLSGNGRWTRYPSNRNITPAFHTRIIHLNDIASFEGLKAHLYVPQS